MSGIPRAPEGTGPAGRRLWRAVMGPFELDGHHVVLLAQAVRVADVVDELERLVAREGLTSVTSQGERVHPAVVEARAQRIVLVRLLASLGLPDDAGKVDGRRRGRPRQPAPLRPVASIGGGERWG